MPYPCNTSSVLGGKFFPGQPYGLRQRLNQFRPSRRPGVAPPNAQYPLQAPQTRLNRFPNAFKRDSDQWIEGRAIPKSAFEPKAAEAVMLTLIWPMYLPMVEDVGQIMRDGRDVKVPRPSTVYIAGVVEGGMGCGRLQPLLTHFFGGPNCLSRSDH